MPAGTPHPASHRVARSHSPGYDRLEAFLTGVMSMSHVYQPLLLRTLLAGGGAATRRQIAAAFLAADLSQLEYYEQIVKGYPTQVLKRHGLVDHEAGVYRLTNEALPANEWERAALIAQCDAKVAQFVYSRQDAIWRHRAQNHDPLPGTVRYEVIKRAKGRCEACGVSSVERALHVDHIVPRAKGGSNDASNLQALCSLCNGGKLDRDDTDFAAFRAAFEHREAGCGWCEAPSRPPIVENALAYAVMHVSPDVEGHVLVAPRRHLTDPHELTQPELNAFRSLELAIARELKAADHSIIGFDIGYRSNDRAGHCRLHIIPNRRIAPPIEPNGEGRGQNRA